MLHLQGRLLRFVLMSVESHNHVEHACPALTLKVRALLARFAQLILAHLRGIAPYFSCDKVSLRFVFKIQYLLDTMVDIVLVVKSSFRLLQYRYFVFFNYSDHRGHIGFLQLFLESSRNYVKKVLVREDLKYDEVKDRRDDPASPHGGMSLQAKL